MDKTAVMTGGIAYEGLSFPKISPNTIGCEKVTAC